MGGIGSDIAIDAADIALVSDDIKYIPHLLRLYHKTMPNNEAKYCPLFTSKLYSYNISNERYIRASAWSFST